MNIYRHKENKKLYTITHIVLDMYHLDANGSSGIIATPYKFDGDIISHQLKDYRMDIIDWFNPEKFVEDNFDIVAEKL